MSEDVKEETKAEVEVDEEAKLRAELKAEIKAEIKAEAELKTFRMRCPICKKSTLCEVLLPPKKAKGLNKKARRVPHHHSYRCTECHQGWVVQTGGFLGV